MQMMAFKVYLGSGVAMLLWLASCTSDSAADSSDPTTETHDSESGGESGSESETSEATSTSGSSTSVGPGSTSVATTEPPASTSTTLDPTSDTETDGSLVGECDFTIQADLSTAIPTVGIVTWSTNEANLDEAYIEFGPDTNYGTEVPVDLSAPDYRTLLLGMTPSTEYHFRITATMGSTVCRSDDETLMAGDVSNNLAQPMVDVVDAGQVEPGFIVTSLFGGGGGGGGGGGSTIVIYNHEGIPVWWFSPDIGQLSRAIMAWDGSSIYGVSANPAGSANGAVVRVSIDGLEEEPITAVPTAHHDLTVTPDNGVVFIGHADDGCDTVEKLMPDGTHTRLFLVSDVYSGDIGGGGGGGFGGNDLCHSNSIHYNAADNTFTLSSLTLNSYAKIDADTGEAVWLLGDHGTLTGDGASWNRQHGHQMVSDTNLLFFNNNGDSGSSVVVEVRLDLAAQTATRVWEYDGGVSSMTFGDVQRLPNGNTLVTYSNAGIIHEVDAEGQLVQSMTWGLGGAIGYATHRPTLYGPPPEGK